MGFSSTVKESAECTPAQAGSTQSVHLIFLRKTAPSANKQTQVDGTTRAHFSAYFRTFATVVTLSTRVARQYFSLT